MATWNRVGDHCVTEGGEVGCVLNDDLTRSWYAEAHLLEDGRPRLYVASGFSEAEEAMAAWEAFQQGDRSRFRPLA